MKRYNIFQIDEHTWRIEDIFHTYCYLLEGEEKAVLFDAGNGFDGLKELVEGLTKKPVEVILSHGHFDHTGCAFQFPFCRIHKNDMEVMQDGFVGTKREEQCAFFEKLYQVTLSETEREFFLHAKMPVITDFVEDKDVIELGGRTLEVIATPGHTKGSICILDRTKRYLFSGDTVCDNEILVYFEHSATVAEVKRSDEKLMERSNEFDLIWPGHHLCPLDASIIEDYIEASKRVIADPTVGVKIPLCNGYKILYQYKTIGISYLDGKIV